MFSWFLDGSPPETEQVARDDTSSACTSASWPPGPLSQGIEHLIFDDASGEVRHLETITGVANLQYLSLRPKLPVLYAAEFELSGRVAAFTVAESGTLIPRSVTKSLGVLAVAVSMHPDGPYAYVFYALRSGSGWRNTEPASRQPFSCATQLHWRQSVLRALAPSRWPASIRR
jgi:hypothetical protein